jgi:hypothetical protein
MTSVFIEDTGQYTGPGGLTTFTRDEFCAHRFDFHPGEHVVFGGPTTRGKTTMAFDLLRYQANPDVPALVAVSKPRDKTTENYGQRLGYRRVESWPPPPKIGELFDRKNRPSGYLIWPKFGDIHEDVPRAARVTAELMEKVYADGVRNRRAILVMDDTMVKAKILGLDRDMVTILAMAGAMEISLWVFVQKPTDSGRTPLWSYENATHLFFTKGGDESMLKRYGEIAGDKGAILRAVVPQLKDFQFLYIHKYEGYVCIVDAE